MLILDGTIGSDIHAFLVRLQEETIAYSIVMYDDWNKPHHSCSDHAHDHDQPEGIIYLRVSPEIAHARINKRALLSEEIMSLDSINENYTKKNLFHLGSPCEENRSMGLKVLQSLPVLVLNGNIDFQTDFAQFYNHLFYIRKFINEIDKRREIALGTYKEKIPHRHCC